MRTRIAALAAAGLLGFSDAAPVAQATIVHIRVTGVVEWNMFPAGVSVWGGLPAGSPVIMEMDVDSEVFVNSPNWPTRGYPPIEGTFSMAISGISAPLLGGVNLAYWVVRNDDPRADGFLFSRMVDFPAEVLLNIGVPSYGVSFLRTFDSIPPGPVGGDPTLTSLDILDAQGSWGFENLSVYNFSVQRGEFSVPIGIEYRTLSIQAVGGVACNIADITEVGGTAEAPGQPDGQLTLDDILLFVNLYNDSTGCPGSAPCSAADLCGTGGPPEPADGQLTLDDILAFIDAYNEACE